MASTNHDTLSVGRWFMGGSEQSVMSVTVAAVVEPEYIACCMACTVLVALPCRGHVRPELSVDPFGRSLLAVGSKALGRWWLSSRAKKKCRGSRNQLCVRIRSLLHFHFPPLGWSIPKCPLIFLQSQNSQMPWVYASIFGAILIPRPPFILSRVV